MLQSTVNTPLAKSYLFKLCKHFARKIPVEFDETSGLACFPYGRCHFTASETALTFLLTAENESQLQQLQQVIEHHLQLMRRAPDPALLWVAPAGSAES